MPTATVQVRHTTTTSTSRASVLVINTGYLTSKLGILKLLVLIFALVAFILMFLEFGYYNKESDHYLILISFADWLTVALMLISALLSLGTASILPKTSFDFIFHFIMGILIFVGGILVSLNAFGRPGRSTKIQTACVMAMVCGIIQIVHGVFSYRLCITN